MFDEQPPYPLDLLDWSATSLGASQGWSSTLRAAVQICIPSHMPMLLMWGPELIQIYNERAAAVLGDKHPAALGRPAEESFAEVWMTIGPLLHAVREEGIAMSAQRQPLTLRRRSYNEESFWTYWFSPVVGPEGLIDGVLVMMQDVTDDVLHERRLRKLRKLGTLSVSGSRNAHDAAAQALQILAGDPADLPRNVAVLSLAEGDPGQQQFAVVEHPGRYQGTPLPPHLPELMVSLLETGEPVLLHAADWDPVDDEGVPPDGPSAVLLPLSSGSEPPLGGLLVALSKHLVFDSEYQAFVRVVGLLVSRVLSDGLVLQWQREQRARLAKLDAARRNVFHSVSHEFRTPLSIITAAMHELQVQPGLPEESLGDLQAAARATSQLEAMVDGLLSIAQGESGGQVGVAEPTDLSVLVGDLVGMFRSIVESRRLSLSVQLDTGQVVVADRESWTRVVMNLLSNAVKFTQAGQVAVTLRYDKDAQGDQVAVLEVADTGVGISPDVQAEVFELFRQGESRAVRGEPGSGIGLALVKEIVNANHGSIELVSARGTGSHFTVRLPAPPCVGPADVADLGTHGLAEIYLHTLESQAPAGGGLPPSPATSENLGRILVVEDNQDLRHYLVRLLRANGYEVTAAVDAETALEVVASHDLVLADLMLTGMSGIDLVRSIRQMEAASALPVVLLTARSGSESLVEGLSAGADDYVTKPFHPVELLARVRAHIDLGQARRLAIEQVEEQAENLAVALRTNRRIGVAIGILQALRRVTTDAAFELLRDESQRQNRKLREVAEDVIAYGTLDVGVPTDRGR